MILESYEDVGIVTTLAAGAKDDRARESGRYKSVVIANVADDYVPVFKRIVENMDELGLKLTPYEGKIADE